MSEVKVNKLSPRLNCGTVTLGDSGDTFTIPAGVTITNNGTQTGFGRTGTVDWDTTAKTANFTAVSGNGYFVNTTSGAITVTLPAGSAGDIVGISDYASTAQTNNILIAPNGIEKINGVNDTYYISTQGLAVTLVYVDATKGWKSVTGSDADATGVVPAFVAATGGTVTCCGDYKIHTFTSPGTFTVTCAGNSGGSNTVDYLVVAGGGGGGGGGSGGGGGAGGFRESKNACAPWTASPLATSTSLPVTAIGYPITVGAGGAASSSGAEAPSSTRGGDGSNSVFSTITSQGGGGGGGGPEASGNPGGSGGGSYTSCSAAGTGNTPPVSPSQGFPGKQQASVGGAGGGATASCSHCFSGAGGDGAGTEIAPASGTCGASAPLKYFAGGGGGGKSGPGVVPAPAQAPPAPSGFNGAAGGDGGGGRGDGGSTPGITAGFACAGATNTGGGGGGGGRQANVTNYPGKAGGSGIVVIRYKYQ